MQMNMRDYQPLHLEVN